jgi:hypothetical protein
VTHLAVAFFAYDGDQDCTRISRCRAPIGRRTCYVVRLPTGVVHALLHRSLLKRRVDGKRVLDDGLGSGAQCFGNGLRRESSLLAGRLARVGMGGVERGVGEAEDLLEDILFEQVVD